MSNYFSRLKAIKDKIRESNNKDEKFLVVESSGRYVLNGKEIDKSEFNSLDKKRMILIRIMPEFQNITL